MIAPEFLSGDFEDNFFPFSLTRSVADIRCGILTLREKWNYLLQEEEAFYPLLKVPGNLIPDVTLIHSLRSDNRESALESASRLVYLTDILRFNAIEIKKDFELITDGLLQLVDRNLQWHRMRLTGPATAFENEHGEIVELRIADTVLRNVRPQLQARALVITLHASIERWVTPPPSAPASITAAR